MAKKALAKYSLALPGLGSLGVAAHPSVQKLKRGQRGEAGYDTASQTGENILTFKEEEEVFPTCILAKCLDCKPATKTAKEPDHC